MPFFPSDSIHAASKDNRAIPSKPPTFLLDPQTIEEGRHLLKMTPSARFIALSTSDNLVAMWKSFLRTEFKTVLLEIKSTWCLYPELVHESFIRDYDVDMRWLERVRASSNVQLAKMKHILSPNILVCLRYALEWREIMTQLQKRIVDPSVLAAWVVGLELPEEPIPYDLSDTTAENVRALRLLDLSDIFRDVDVHGNLRYTFQGTINQHHFLRFHTIAQVTQAHDIIRNIAELVVRWSQRNAACRNMDFLFRFPQHTNAYRVLLNFDWLPGSLAQAVEEDLMKAHAEFVNKQHSRARHGRQQPKSAKAKSRALC